MNSGEDNPPLEQSPMLTPPQEQTTPETIPQPQPGQASGTQETDNTLNPPIPQTHLNPIDEGTPMPSFPPVESKPSETESETQEQNNGTIQGEGINPWL